MKIKNIIIGIVIIIFGIFGILEVSGAIPPLDDISYTQLISGLILAGLTVAALSKRKICTALYLISFIFMIFEYNIATLIYPYVGRNLINNWLLLLFVTIICVGIMFITPKSYRKYIKIESKHEKNANTETNNFGENSTYIDCSDFTEKHIINSFGETEIHFENTEEYSGGGVLIIENLFGETRVYVPNDWLVTADVKTIFGDSSNSIPRAQNGPELVIKGQNKFGEIDIIGV